MKFCRNESGFEVCESRAVSLGRLSRLNLDQTAYLQTFYLHSLNLSIAYENCVMYISVQYGIVQCKDSSNIDVQGGSKSRAEAEASLPSQSHFAHLTRFLNPFIHTVFSFPMRLLQCRRLQRGTH